MRASEEGDEYVVVFTNDGFGHPSYAELNAGTKSVHIQGDLTLGMTKHILSLAPQLKRIRVIPHVMYITSDETKALLVRCGIDFIEGHKRPDLRWSGCRLVFFRKQQAFFRKLVVEKQLLWEELLLLEVKAAFIAKRYFCLEEGDDYVSQVSLARDFHVKTVSYLINGIMYYMDPSYPAGESSRKFSEIIRGRVKRARKKISLLRIRSRMQQEFGAETIPVNFPLRYMGELETILCARRDGSLEKLRRADERVYTALILRFGEGDVKELTEVSQWMNGIPISTVCWLVKRGLEQLRV